MLIAKKDIMFHGFGIYSHYYKYKMDLKLRWGLDDDKGEEKDITIEDSEKDETNNWHVFEISRVGDKPFQVKSGQKLNVGISAVDDNSRRTLYGRNRSQNYEIEDNEE